MADPISVEAGRQWRWQQQRVGELMEEGGAWRACSGCQESVDGCVSCTDYPYSDLFRCQPGSGCSECGGIGVLWEEPGYWDGYAEAALADDAPSLPRDMVLVPTDVVAFLMGEAAYDGTWFNELNDGLPGAFWWRAILATARRQSATNPEAVSQVGEKK